MTVRVSMTVNGKAVWTGKVALAPDHILTAPLHWKKPRRIFVNSMSDLFHADVPDVDWMEAVSIKTGFGEAQAAWSTNVLVKAVRAEGVAFDAGFNALHVGRSPSRFRAAGELPHAAAAHAHHQARRRYHLARTVRVEHKLQARLRARR